MAKSARSSDRKRNNANLRATIFGPAHDARTARLSAKLQELVNKPKPEQEKVMDVDEDEKVAEQTESHADQDLDVEMSGAPTSISKKRKTHSVGRVEKKNSRRKPRNKVVFPTSAAKKKRIAQSKKKSV